FPKEIVIGAGLAAGLAVALAPAPKPVGPLVKAVTADPERVLEPWVRAGGEPVQRHRGLVPQSHRGVPPKSSGSWGESSFLAETAPPCGSHRRPGWRHKPPRSPPGPKA